MRGSPRGRAGSQEARRLSEALFDNPRIRVVPRPKKDDSAEVYIGEEFIGVLFVDDEDDERSYNFQMAILVAAIRACSRCRRSRPICAASSTTSHPRRPAAEERIRWKLYRRGISRRAVRRERDGPQVLYFRVADPRPRPRAVERLYAPGGRSFAISFSTLPATGRQSASQSRRKRTVTSAAADAPDIEAHAGRRPGAVAAATHQEIAPAPSRHRSGLRLDTAYLAERASLRSPSGPATGSDSR